MKAARFTQKLFGREPVKKKKPASADAAPDQPAVADPGAQDKAPAPAAHTGR
jgi:hypothetical protein